MPEVVTKEVEGNWNYGAKPQEKAVLAILTEKRRQGIAYAKIAAFLNEACLFASKGEPWHRHNLCHAHDAGILAGHAPQVYPKLVVPKKLPEEPLPTFGLFHKIKPPVQEEVPEKIDEPEPPQQQKIAPKVAFEGRWRKVPKTGYGINTEERMIADRIQSFRDAGLSYAGIAKRLNKEGFKTRTGKPWQTITAQIAHYSLIAKESDRKLVCENGVDVWYFLDKTTKVWGSSRRRPRIPMPVPTFMEAAKTKWLAQVMEACRDYVLETNSDEVYKILAVEVTAQTKAGETKVFHLGSDKRKRQ
jgi:hypothetical protein